MDLPHISRIRFLTAEGTEVESPGEWSPGLVEVLVPAEEWAEVRIWRQGEPLEVFAKSVGGEKRVLAEWPRSDTGYYKVKVEAAGWQEERVIELWPQKIGRRTYAQMLLALETQLPVSVAVSLQKCGGLAGVQLPPAGETTLAMELVRLRRA